MKKGGDTMKKEWLDGLFILMLFFIVTLIKSLLTHSFDLLEIATNFIPALIIALLIFYKNLSKIVTFIIIFFTFFILLSINPEEMVDWTSYLITGVSAFLISLMYLVLKIVIDNKLPSTNPLQGTTLNWLSKKFPTKSLTFLFILNTLISTVILTFFLALITQNFTLSIFLLCLTISSYFSASNIYFYLYLPKKES